MRAGMCPARPSASVSSVVPTTFTRPWRLASVRDCPVPVSAARWTTTSGRMVDSSASHAVGTVTSKTCRITAGGSSGGQPRPACTCGCRTSATVTS
jgi:hypothetical protein